MQKLRIPRFITQSQFPRHFGQRHGCGEFERYPPLRGGQDVGRDPGARPSFQTQPHRLLRGDLQQAAYLSRASIFSCVK